MADGRPTISTHVLDTAAGTPRSGVRVILWRLPEGSGPGRVVGTCETDADGRIRDLLGGAPLEPGRYRIEFRPGGGFFERAALDIRVDDPSRGHHVPLLLAPYGLTTYRGS